MERTIVIGIGGTGSKCVESLLHLKAVGTVGRDCELWLIDQDRNNGNIARTKALAESYRELRSELRAVGLPRNSSLFASDCLPVDQVFQPVTNPENSLERTFGVARSADLMTEPAAVLMWALFSKADREQAMENGFNARPAVGSAAFLSSRGKNHLMWQSLEQVIDDAGREVDVRILLLGSVFGGTGAAGLPTIARYVRDRFLDPKKPRVRLGAVMMAPYFKLKGDGDYGPMRSEEVRLSLDHYARLCEQYDLRGHRLFDAIYLIGMSPFYEIDREDKGGGQQQVNPPLLPEFLAALGGVHFLNDAYDALPGRVWLCARESNTDISWTDVPRILDKANLDHVQAALVSFARFAYAYVYAYLCDEKLSEVPSLQDMPCYFRHLNVERVRKGLYNDPADHMNTYCKAFLCWFGSLHRFQSEPVGVSLDLLNLGELIEQKTDPKSGLAGVGLIHDPADATRTEEIKAQFEKLWAGPPKPDNLAKVLTRMSRLQIRRQGKRSFGRFVDALHRSCSIAAIGQ